MYHIPVNPEGQPVFEHAYKQQLMQIQNQPGLYAYRFLKPIGSDSYIILTQWQEESVFKAWQNSASYISVNDLKLPKVSAQKLFTGDPFTSKYSAPTIDLIEKRKRPASKVQRLRALRPVATSL